MLSVGLQLGMAGGGSDANGCLISDQQPTTRDSQTRSNSVRMFVAARSGGQDGLSSILRAQAINIVSIGDALFERVAAHACAGVWDLVKTVKLIDRPPVRQAAIRFGSLRGLVRAHRRRRLSGLVRR